MIAETGGRGPKMAGCRGRGPTPRAETTGRGAGGPVGWGARGPGGKCKAGPGSRVRGGRGLLPFRLLILRTKCGPGKG